MITSKDIYDVLAAIVPLYVAMILAYGSVRWWKIFTPDQCSGIFRFVKVFAIPVYSLQLILTNNPYAMNFKFIAADSLQKVVILVALFLWQAFSKRGNLDWTITAFSLCTFPNTIVIGIPLFKTLYGDFSTSLMAQIVILQCVIWYTVLLFLHEYRAAKLLISEQFPETARSIGSFRVDADVVSLSGREPIQADAEIGDDGKLQVTVRRSNASSIAYSFNDCYSHRLNSTTSMAPRASNLTDIDVYSIQSSRFPTPRASSFNQTYFNSNFDARTEPSPKHGYTKSFQGGIDDVYSLQSSKGSLTPWTSNFDAEMLKSGRKRGGNLRHALDRAASIDFGFIDSSYSNKAALHQHESAASKLTRESISHETKGGKEHDVEDARKLPPDGLPVTCHKKMDVDGDNGSKKHQMPPTSVMTRLILTMVCRSLKSNPNTYSRLLGVIWSLISFRWQIKMPSFITGSISLISDTSMGTAMFTIGFFMASQPNLMPCGKAAAAFAMALRFLIGPAVIAITSVALGIRGALLNVTIVQAALSLNVVPFIFAMEYNLHPDILSTALIFGMLITLPIIILYYAFLGI